MTSIHARLNSQFVAILTMCTPINYTFKLIGCIHSSRHSSPKFYKCKTSGIIRTRCRTWVQPCWLRQPAVKVLYREWVDTNKPIVYCNAGIQYTSVSLVLTQFHITFRIQKIKKSVTRVLFWDYNSWAWCPFSRFFEINPLKKRIYMFVLNVIGKKKHMHYILSVVLFVCCESCHADRYLLLPFCWRWSFSLLSLKKKKENVN